MKPLSPKEQRFVDEYILDLNATKAAARVWPGRKPAASRKHGTRLLSSDHVSFAIAEKIQALGKKVSLSAEYVLNGLKEVAERSLQRSPVLEWDPENKCKAPKIDDHGRSVWEFDSSGANKAFELLGRHLKLFTDKLEIDLSEGTFERLERGRERARHAK